MPENCLNCRFFELHKRAHYPRGKCLKQFAFRISDNFKIYLDIVTPSEFKCDFFEATPKLIYAVTDKETYLVPPIIADDLVKQGWKLITLDNNEVEVRKK